MIPRVANRPELVAAFDRVALHLRDGIPPLEALSALEIRCLKAVRLRQMECRRPRGRSAELQSLYERIREAE